MKKPDPRDPGPGESEPDDTVPESAYEIDYTKIEGRPTEHAQLDIALRFLGLTKLRVKTNFTMAQPGMIASLGFILTALMILALLVSQPSILSVLVTAAMALVILGSSMWLAWHFSKRPLAPYKGSNPRRRGKRGEDRNR